MEHDTFLMACKQGNLTDVRMLISKDQYLDHGLRLACIYGHIEIAKLLIANGAREMNDCLIAISQEFKNINRNFIGIIDLLIRNGGDCIEHCLYYACSCGNLNIVKHLIYRHGASAFNAGLHEACLNNHADITKMMLDCGANNLQDCFTICQYSPISFESAKWIAYKTAVPLKCESMDLLEFLLENGVDINVFVTSRKVDKMQLKISLFRDAIQDVDVLPTVLLSMISRYSLF